MYDKQWEGTENWFVNHKIDFTKTEKIMPSGFYWMTTTVGDLVAFVW